MPDVLDLRAAPAARALLQTLRDKGVRLELEGERLRAFAAAGVMTGDLQDAIREQKQALLYLLAMEAEERELSGGAHAHSGKVRLTPAQERLWLFQQLEPAASTYNLAPLVRIGGALDVSRLADAVRKLLDRHEPLRSVVGSETIGGTILPTAYPERLITFTDLTGVSAAERQGALHELVKEEQRTPFVLDQEIPFRAKLFRVEADVHFLLITIHHIAVDGVSLEFLLRDLIDLYSGKQLDALRAGYRDYANWQRSYWTAERLQERGKHWRDALAGAPFVLDLPTDFPRSRDHDYSGAMLSRGIPRAEMAAVSALAREENASLFMVLLGAFSAALYRESGQQDLIIGSPLHGREKPEFAKLVGMFVNQLPFRMRVAPRGTVRELVRTARTAVLSNLTEHEMPFGELVEMVTSQRMEGVSPLFQAMLNVLPGVSLDRGIATEGLEFKLPPPQETLALFDGQSKFDLTLYAFDGGDEVHLVLVYNNRLFSAERMGSLLHGVEQVLALAATPEVSLARSLQGPTPRSESVPSAMSPGSGLGAVDVILENARRAPTARAIYDQAGSLTYQELVRASRRVAAHIGTLSLGKQAPIGVMAQHDRSAAVSILGVLLSGHPYLPLDPEYPTERLRFMAADAGLGAVVTTMALGDRVAAVIPATVPVFTLEATEAPCEAPLELPAPEDVAYLLYTSGSTGQPKAVMQSHRNLLEQARRYAEMLALGPDDRVALLASISFDASLMDLFGGLISGASVRALDPRAIDFSLLPEIVRQEEITVLHFTPTVFRSLARVAGNADWGSVRTVVLGGEPIRPDHVEFFDRCFAGKARLLNLYGASEHSFSIGEFIDRTQRSLEVPVGLPLGDVEVSLVGADGIEDPVLGEMVIRSAHNAIGYWNPGAAPSGVFTPDAAETGRSFYRTGDLARRRPDGRFVVLGRVDAQIKVRGHRVEPGEVEAVLRRHPDVLDAGVHAPFAADGERVLTACYIARPGAEVDRRALAAWCAEHLPRYLVPSEWVATESLPRTASGKIDRNALPDADSSLAAGSALGARDADESELLAIWTEVLETQSFDVHDDFFEHGGHSLNATHVVARIRDALGVELPLRYFFDHPTIAEIAAWVRENRQAGSVLPALSRRADGDRAPLSFSQERLWFLQQMDPSATAYNMAGASLLEGPLDLEKLRAAFDVVAMRQEALRTRIVEAHGRPTQVVSPHPTHLFLVEDVTLLDPEQRMDAAREVVERYLGAPYDIASGPLCRVVLVRMDDDRHLLGFGTHHTISDLVSYAIAGRELRLAYEGDVFEPLPVTYRDYSIWQREWLQGESLEAQVEFWRGRLKGLAPLDVPTDFPRPAFVSFAGDALHAELPAGLRQLIQRFSVANRATPFMTLLAAFNTLLSAYGNSEDIAVGVPIAGRSVSETQNLIGTFVNTLVHRNDLSGNPTFRELVARVRSSALDAYARQDAPFELLVKELQPPRDTSRAPFFQVLFNVANMRVDAAPLKGTRQSFVPLQRKASQFDFSVNVGLNDAQSMVSLTYNTALFSKATGQRMLQHYLEILEAALTEPERRLRDLRTPSRRDCQSLLVEWNATERAVPEGANLLSLLAATAQRRPGAVAVDSPTGSFTYAELIAYARGVTSELRRVGVDPGDRVAIVMQRSREMLGALLGILGAGAAYVPVDPNYPAARVSYMLEDSGAAAVVSHRGLEKPYDPRVPVLRLDGWSPTERADFASLRPHDAAYVIYTSGSTGKPKGVEIPHRAMANFLLSMQEQPGFGEDDRLLAVTTISFDIAVLELYLPLISGGRVVIASEDEALDGRRLIRLMEEAGITMMQATPATWKLLMAAGWSGSPSLRVLCGGEPLPRALADDLLDRVAELWNMYGPTETTVWSTLDRIERGKPILVGRPIANTTVYVLRDDLSLCPVGVAGELFIGGAGVANGYVGRPDLTAERFIPDPFRAGERIYRTGDLVRYRADGRIEHLGRLDNQVKVRGFRIELGEVEAALQSHEAVRDAVVVASDDRLVGYVVLQEGAHATATDLRNWVSGSLPQYMVPALLMTLDELPLTPNGKVDRKQLPAPEGAVVEARRVSALSTPAEMTVAKIWASLLGVSEVGASDNFFELGGHSLLAMEAVALIEERTGHRPEPRSLFFMTLGDLAASIPDPVVKA